MICPSNPTLAVTTERFWGKPDQQICRNHDINPRLYLNSVIASMPYFEKATDDELCALLPHKWKEYHPEPIMTTSVRELAK